jgi:hypothetical protein
MDWMGLDSEKRRLLTWIDCAKEKMKVPWMELQTGNTSESVDGWMDEKEEGGFWFSSG